MYFDIKACIWWIKFLECVRFINTVKNSEDESWVFEVRICFKVKGVYAKNVTTSCLNPLHSLNWKSSSINENLEIITNKYIEMWLNSHTVPKLQSYLLKDLLPLVKNENPIKTGKRSHCAMKWLTNHLRETTAVSSSWLIRFSENLSSVFMPRCWWFHHHEKPLWSSVRRFVGRSVSQLHAMVDFNRVIIVRSFIESLLIRGFVAIQ